MPNSKKLIVKSFEIDSGRIFTELKEKWKRFDRQFLTSIEDNFYYKLRENKIVTVSFDGNNGEYLEGYAIHRYPKALDWSKSEEHFPFPDYNLTHDENNSKYHLIIRYDESCVVSKGESDFDLFFALKLALVDIMEIDRFLAYQLERNFGNDYIDYSDFMTKLLLKYSDFLRKEQEPLTKDFLAKNFTKKESFVASKESNNEVTTSMQVLAMYYLFEELKVNRSNTSITAIARFIQFLTGKELGAKNISNTNIELGTLYTPINYLYCK